MQFWFKEGDSVEQLLDHCILFRFVLLRDHAQFGVGFLIYGGLYTLCVSCVLPITRISLKLLC